MNEVGQPAVSRCQVTGEADENSDPPLVRFTANNSHQSEITLALYHNKYWLSNLIPVHSATTLDDGLLDGCVKMG
jgi:hypothetical protein